MKNLLKKLKSWGVSRRPVADLSRRQSSLVSCGELTPDAVQLWLGLPDEVKFDPALEDFRKLYEKEHGGVLGVSSQGSKSNRLLLVSSAPHLNGNLQIASNIILKDGERQNCDFKADKEQTEEKVDETSTPRRISKLAKMGHYTKMTLLVASWVFFTVIFLMFNERELIVMNSAVSPGEVKKFFINSSSVRNSLLITLSGPFLSEQTEQKMNKTEFQKMSKFEVWLENNDQSINEVSKLWQILLQDITSLDFNTGETRSSVLKLKSSNLNQTSYAVKLRSTVDAVTPFRMTVLENPLDIKTGVLYASFLLVALYTLIIFEIVNRTMAAVIVSISSLAVLAMVGQRPTIPEVISWLDVETLILLFSMMLLVAIMAETGIFDFFAVFTFEVTKGRLWPLVTVLCIITAVVSTFLDNVTTILLMIPVTIRLCEVMDLNPVPILMSMVLYSNIGGTATPVGDPPNVIIASNKAVIQAVSYLSKLLIKGINFANFTLHMTLGIILVCIQTYFQLRFIYRDSNKLRLNVPREIQDLRNTISIWRRAIDSLPHLSKDELIVRERLEKKVRKLSSQLHVLVRESSKRACPKDTFQSTLNELKNKHKIRDKVLLLKASVAILFVVTVFFLHSLPELNRVSLGWTALLGAILLLILADRENLEPILHRVEWSTLLFFAALFVLMEALSKLGLIEFIGGLTESLILMVDEKARLAVALLLMIWVSGITSAFIDNIPLTTMMIRIVTSLGSNPNLGLPMAPLIWALSFAVCLGGNGTLIGASANVVCAGVAEQHGYKFTFLEFFKVGFPVMIGHLIVASGYLLLCHCVFTWH